MELIDKAAVVAEIERLQDSIKATAIDDRISKEQAEAYKVCVKLRSYVEDTLEVKEVDLEESIKNAFKAGYELGIQKTQIRTEDEHWQDVRERAAIAAMQGVLADPSRDGNFKDYAVWAVAYTDALIEELKKK